MRETGLVCMRGHVQNEMSEQPPEVKLHLVVKGQWGANRADIVAPVENPTLDQTVSDFMLEFTELNYAIEAFPPEKRTKWSGFFMLAQPDGTAVRVSESEVWLKFSKNTAGNFNVDGRGRNSFGSFRIHGTLSDFGVDGSVPLLEIYKTFGADEAEGAGAGTGDASQASHRTQVSHRKKKMLGVYKEVERTLGFAPPASLLEPAYQTQAQTALADL